MPNADQPYWMIAVVAKEHEEIIKNGGDLTNVPLLHFLILTECPPLNVLAYVRDELATNPKNGLVGKDVCVFVPTLETMLFFMERAMNDPNLKGYVHNSHLHPKPSTPKPPFLH